MENTAAHLNTEVPDHVMYVKSKVFKARATGGELKVMHIVTCVYFLILNDLNPYSNSVNQDLDPLLTFAF